MTECCLIRAYWYRVGLVNFLKASVHVLLGKTPSTLKAKLHVAHNMCVHEIQLTLLYRSKHHDFE